MYRFWTRYETQRVWASDLEIHRGQGQPIIYYQTLFKDGQLYLSKKENVTLPTEIAFMRNVLFKGPRFHSIISDYLQEEVKKPASQSQSINQSKVNFKYNFN